MEMFFDDEAISTMLAVAASEATKKQGTWNICYSWDTEKSVLIGARVTMEAPALPGCGGEIDGDRLR